MSNKLEFVSEQTKPPLYQEIFPLLGDEHKKTLGNIVKNDQEIKEILFQAVLRLRYFADTGDQEPINSLLDSSIEVGDFLVASKVMNKHIFNKPHSILSFMREHIEQEKPFETSS
ncbi:MAG: hypothetical protein ABII80_01400 [bacterium]